MIRHLSHPGYVVLVSALAFLLSLGYLALELPPLSSHPSRRDVQGSSSALHLAAPRAQCSSASLASCRSPASRHLGYPPPSMALAASQPSSSSIPCLIHRTRRSLAGIEEGPTLDNYFLSWSAQNPGCIQVIWDAVSQLDFVEAHAPEYLKEFLWLKSGVERADLFRYLVLLVLGGVYSDWDTQCIRPIASWTFGEVGVSAVVGVEWDRPYAPGDDYQFVQWTIAAAPNHTLLRGVCDIVRQNIMREMTGQPVWYSDAPPDNQIIKRTGPLAWTQAVQRYLEAHDSSPKLICDAQRPVLVGDVLFLPVWGFSPGVGHSRSRPVSDPQACVQHFFSGSWKP